MELSAIDEKVREAFPGGEVALKYVAEREAYTITLGVPAVLLSIAVHESAFEAEDTDGTLQQRTDELVDQIIDEVHSYAMESFGLDEAVTQKAEAHAEAKMAEIIQAVAALRPGTVAKCGDFRAGYEFALKQAKKTLQGQ